MPLPKEQIYTSEDYWNLPDGQRAELIDGKLYNMAPPHRIHQELVMELSATIRQYIIEHTGNCKIYPAPFAVNLTANDKIWVEPDISVICDKSKLSDRGCEGAPDWIIEIVSQSSKPRDYMTKLIKYRTAGVREYWIVDPGKQMTTAYSFERDWVEHYGFETNIPVGIFKDFFIRIQ